MKKRFIKLATVCAVFFLGGCAYALFVRLTGWGIPCLFRLATGLQCPGCGVSRMLIALLHLDFAGAWQHNPMLLCLLPLGIGLAVEAAISYIKFGAVPQKRWRTAVIWIMILLLLAFGVLRNL